MKPHTGPACLFCGAETTGPDHLLFCDGRQGHVEATIDPAADFDGDTYDRERDHDRLNAQLRRVLARLQDRAWHTLGDLSSATGDPEASVSARLRDLRKEKFGAHVIERQYLSDGLWQYRMNDPERGQ